MGALSINGIAALRAPFEPLVPDVVHVRNTNRYHRPPDETEEEFTAFLLDDLEEAIEQAGPETVAMVIFEPVQNAGGSFTPPAGYFAGRARDLRPLRHPALRRRGDHRLRPHRRVVRRASKYDIKPDLITCAKGLSSSLRGDRRGARRRQGVRRVQQRDVDVLARDHVRRPPGRLRDRAQEPRDHGARARSSSTSREHEDGLPRRSSRRCSSSTSSATCAAPATSGRSSS